jgi:hypothetical protein
VRALVRLLVASSLLAAVSAVAPQVAFPARAACGVSIYEIYYDSPGTDTGSNSSLNGEWIQLRNSCSTGKSLYHWTVRDAAGHIYKFGTYTLGGSKKVKVHTGNGTNSATDRYWNAGGYVWNNTGPETARLKNAAGTSIDSCSYSGNSLGYVYC